MDCIHVNQPIIFTWQFFANNLILKKFHQHFFLSSFIHLLPENFNNMKLSRGNDVDLVCLSYHIYIYIYIYICIHRCFNLFILHNNSFDNQGYKINKNIFLGFGILSSAKTSYYTFNKLISSYHGSCFRLCSQLT